MDHAVKVPYQFDSSQTAGQMLRGLREHAGVELEVLAAALKVPAQKIDALEQDNLTTLPAYFARGLSSNICRYLDADPHPVLAKLPDDKPRIATDDESINAPFSPHRFGSGMRSGVPSWALAGAGLLAVGALVLFLYPTISSKLGGARAGASAASATQGVEPVDAASAPQTDSQTNLQGQAAAVPSNLQAAPVAAPSNLQPAPAASAVVAPDAAASAAAAAPGGDGLTFRATGETWVQVRSPAGKTLYERTLKAGESDQVAVAAYPVRVTIGRAENVQLSDRGQAFDLAKVASIGVARFDLK